MNYSLYTMSAGILCATAGIVTLACGVPIGVIPLIVGIQIAYIGGALAAAAFFSKNRTSSYDYWSGFILGAILL